MNLTGIGPLVLIGAGKMGLALARGWIAAGLAPGELVLVDPSPAPAAEAFARDTGVIVKPADACKVADAVVRVFIDHGNRTDRTKARLKYVLDSMGVDKFLGLLEERLGQKLDRVVPGAVVVGPPFDRAAHIFRPFFAPSTVKVRQKAARTASDSSGQAVRAHSSKSRSVSATSASSAAGSIQRNVPLWPKWP